MLTASRALRRAGRYIYPSPRWLAIALSSFRKLHLESEMRVTCSLLNCSRLYSGLVAPTGGRERGPAHAHPMGLKIKWVGMSALIQKPKKNSPTIHMYIKMDTGNESMLLHMHYDRNFRNGSKIMNHFCFFKPATITSSFSVYLKNYKVSLTHHCTSN